MLRAQKPNHETIDANTSVEEKEENEVLVIVEADAIVDPDAVMVELFDAYIAERAMFRTRWLWHIASVTPSFLVKQELIIIVAFDSSD